jgi:hypothetical protein
VPSIRRFPAPLRDGGGDEIARNKWSDLAVCFLSFLPSGIGPLQGDLEEAHGYWEQHGEEITQEHIAEYPGSRPDGWWLWTQGLTDTPEDQTAFLDAHGLLTDAERESLDDSR